MNPFKNNLPLKIKMRLFWAYIKNIFSKTMFVVFDNAGILIMILFIASVAFLFSSINTKCKYDSIDNETGRTLILNDTNLNARRAFKESQDTIIKFIDKIIYVHQPPKIIYYNKADTNYLKEFPGYDVMTSIEINSDGIRTFAVNAADSTIKEYVFDDVGPFFTITSQKGNLYLKARRIWWNGIRLKPEYELSNIKSLKLFDKNILLGIETDINFGTRFAIGINPKYDTGNKDFKLNIFVKIKL